MGKIIFAIIFAIGGAIGISYYMNMQALTKEDFNKYKKEFRAEMDTLKVNQDSLKIRIKYVLKNQKKMLNNIDTLKAGQYILHSDLQYLKDSLIVGRKQEKSFKEKLINFLK